MQQKLILDKSDNDFDNGKCGDKFNVFDKD